MNQICTGKALSPIVLIILMAALLCGLYGANMCNPYSLVDPLLIATIQELDCPYWISEQIANYSGRTGSISIINDNGLICIESHCVGKYMVETYQGETDDYLLIYRIGDNVFCAQYINAQEPEQETSIQQLKRYSYFHPNTYFHGGLYVSYETGFFSDGKICMAIYCSPDHTTPDIIRWQDSSSFLSDSNQFLVFQ